MNRCLELIKKHNFYQCVFLFLIFGACSLLYYFGQIVDLEGWTNLRWEFLYGPHDIERLLFLVPLAYAYYFFGFRVMLTVTAASIIVFLPRAIFISPYPDALPRALFFAMAPVFVYPLVKKSQRSVPQEYKQEEALDATKNNLVTVIPGNGNGKVFSAGEVDVDFTKRLVRRHGQIVKLTPTEYKLLECLVRNSGKVMTTTELLHECWGPEFGQESEYVRNFISQLRFKIEDDPSNPRLILTEPRFGYRFLDPEEPGNNHSATATS
jgi:DNA-binding winged helix-turn-helix (wHTH) protein